MALFLTPATGLFCILGGMVILRQGLQRLAGTRLRRVIIWMALNPWRAFLSGTVVTALVQSSSILTVMTVSFVDAGLLPFANALYLILGSNIGTTVTTQLLAFPLDSFSYYAMLLGSLGFLFLNSRWRYLALGLLGLGLLFFGLMTLETGLEPFVNQAGIQHFIHSLGDHHWRGVAAGALLSALLHSSSATTGIVMLLTEEGWLTLPTAIAFVLGANIGTCFTAVLASLATETAARRVAYFHILLNVFGVLVFLPFLHPFVSLLTHLGGNLARQVANAHTLFNIISSLLAFPLVPAATRLLKRL
ncbi:MAG: Na/Pi symporter [Desulfitobacteriaceae bacterium]|nr:Na/Pi symporter [Desulfitobacteriaceae bacterium]MDI6879173.1 Na/Pi symporter [Desulfitobacteriaceae bacterium]MDI6914942.1 Na/Pi symporter [Desulfitobacteriaceae bacterium]